jgi:ribosomal protein L14
MASGLLLQVRMIRARSLFAFALVPASLLGARFAEPMVVERAEALRGTRPAAKAFLETSEVSDVPGARKLEHLFVIGSKHGRAPGEYQASTVSVFQNGACQGARFAEVVPGSVYAHLGIRADDLIRRIDGAQVETPEKALEIYSKLLQQRRVEVEVERQGRPSLEVYQLD